MPWGDGIIDVQNLIVLAERLFEEVPLPIELVAYGNLDAATLFSGLIDDTRIYSVFLTAEQIEALAQ